MCLPWILKVVWDPPGGENQWRQTHGLVINAPSHFASHVTFYLENLNLHFIRHHRSFPLWHPSSKPGRGKLPFFIFRTTITTTTKFNLNHSKTIIRSKTRTTTFLTGFYSLVLLFSSERERERERERGREREKSLYKFFSTNILKENQHRWYCKDTVGKEMTRNHFVPLSRGTRGARGL
jgi:hypothetical protein